jgi:hypothetical protein
MSSTSLKQLSRPYQFQDGIERHLLMDLALLSIERGNLYTSQHSRYRGEAVQLLQGFCEELKEFASRSL